MEFDDTVTNLRYVFELICRWFYIFGGWAKIAYLQFAAQFTSTDPQTLKVSTGIAADKIARLDAAIRGGKVCQLNQLAGIDGIGEKTLEKLFRYCQNPQPLPDFTQPELNW